MKKAEDEEITANIEANKVKKENLEVTGAKCWRGKWQSALEFTGEIFATVKATKYVVLMLKWKYFSETWILPCTLLSAMGVYTVFAIAFYNNWL